VVPIELISYEGACITIGDHTFINYGSSIPKPGKRMGGPFLSRDGAFQREVSYNTRSQEFLCSVEPLASSQLASLRRWDPPLLR
jgi:hypothetical protein